MKDYPKYEIERLTKRDETGEARSEGCIRSPRWKKVVASRKTQMQITHKLVTPHMHPAKPTRLQNHPHNNNKTSKQIWRATEITAAQRPQDENPEVGRIDRTPEYKRGMWLWLRSYELLHERTEQRCRRWDGVGGSARRPGAYIGRAWMKPSGDGGGGGVRFYFLRGSRVFWGSPPLWSTQFPSDGSGVAHGRSGPRPREMARQSAQHEMTRIPLVGPSGLLRPNWLSQFHNFLFFGKCRKKRRCIRLSIFLEKKNSVDIDTYHVRSTEHTDAHSNTINRSAYTIHLIPVLDFSALSFV
jgi:hypothetical protein